MRREFTLRNRGKLRHVKSAISALLLAGIAAIPSSLQAQSSSATPYCTVAHPYTSSNYNDPCNAPLAKILRVELNNLDHTANCPDGRGIYTYWNNVDPANISPGAVYDITVTSGVTTTYYNEFGVWIDFNGDGDFSDANEFIGRGQTYGPGAKWTKAVTIPCNAVAGKTRMRVRNDYSYSGSPYTYNQSNECGNSTYGNQGYGETWDFDVQIGSVGPANANFAVPDTVYVNSPTTFVNANPSGYISHEWDAINLGNTPDDTKTNFTWTFPTTGTHQVRLTSTNCQGTSINTKTFTVVNPTSSPNPVFVVSDNEIVYDGLNPIYIDFYDLSTFGPTQWEWIMTPDMLNGAPYIWTVGSQFDQNPSAFFYDFEIYDVCLAVGNGAGWDTLCKSGYINIKQPGAGSSIVNVMGQSLGSDVDSGWIYDSGGQPDNYKDNEYLEFLIAPCGASQVTLTFNTFNVAAGDELMVFDGNSSTADQLGSFTGTNLPATVTSTGGSIYLVFLSNNTGNSAGFSAYWTSNIPNNGAPTADFTVPDTVYQCALGNDVRFQNASTGILPDQASYDWIFDYDPNVAYPTGYADAKDETNPTWSYFSTGTYNVRMVLKSCEGNDTVVKSFVVGTTTNNPIVDFSATERIVKVGDVVTLTDMSVASCEYEWVISPNTYTIENGGDEFDPVIDVKFTAPASYNIKLIVKNDNGSTTHEKTNYIDVIEYCSPAVFYPTVADVGINSVKVGNMTNNSTSGQVPGFTDNSGKLNIDLTLGATYNFEISRNTTVNGINRKIWIDYNRDGDFDDANELVASQTGATGATFTGSFTVPGMGDVILGEAKMRIGASLINTPLNPCGPAQVGEYEDYAVTFVTDDQLPVITITGTDVIIEVNGTYTDQGATAFDNIEGDITSEIVMSNGVDMSQPGVYFVSYDVSDKSGNKAPTALRKVTVVADLTEPVITLNGTSPLIWSVMVPFVEPGFSATDNPGNTNVDALVNVSGMVDETVIGDYDLVYTVYDAYGNKAEVTRTVQVRDTTAPMIVSDPVVEVQVGSTFIDPVTASDNFDKNPSLVKVSGDVNSNAVGTYTQTYSATDMAGNKSADVTITFEVADYIAPTIHYIPGTEIVIVQVFDFNWMSNPNMGVTATDNYYSFADLEVIYPANFSIDVVGEYTITYKATDNNGNVSTFDRVVRVVDSERPTVVTEPLNLMRWSTYDFTMGVSVVDNYYAPADFANETNGCKLVIIRSTVDFNYPGIYEVCYQAIDGSGNTSAITCRTVKISDESAATGLSDVNMDDLVQVYPNPNNGNFTIQIDAVLNANTSVTVVNAQGQTVRVIENAQFVGGELQVNLNGTAPGVYFVRVKTGDQLVNKKITIQ